ncbi:MAG: tetratricopeptide repeat protein [Gemmatimonadaceae bacterium]|nr:tetratricopeptide repeat protein [Gemmatimonadaceae bacterium]
MLHQTRRLGLFGRALSLGMALTLGTVRLGAQSPPEGVTVADSLRMDIDAAVATNDPGTLRRARVAAERAALRFPGDPWVGYYRAYAAFREAGLLLSTARAKEVSAFLNPAVQAIEDALDRVPSAEGFALLSALQGQRLTASGSAFTAIRLGPSVLRAIGKAEALAPTNPRVWLLKGINAYNAPSAFGGGQQNAEQHLRKAIALFATFRAPIPAPTWGLADAWIWLGRSLQAQGRPAEARAAYQTAVQLEPWNLWVTGTLLPSLDRGARKTGA